MAITNAILGDFYYLFKKCFHVFSEINTITVLCFSHVFKVYTQRVLNEK